MHYFNQYHKINKRHLAYLFGWGFGDGGLISALSYYFVCGKKEDLIRIKEYLNKEVPCLPIVLDKNFGKSVIKLVNGRTKNISSDNSWILYMRDSSFCKLLYALGLPKGEKVLQETQIPLWIKEGGKDIKKAFLNSLLEGELQTHKVVNNPKKNKIEIIPTTFGLSKIKEYKENLVEFLNELRVLLEEFNIKSTKVQKPISSNIRKDGYMTYSSRFYISTSALNIVNISKIIDFPFNRQKRDGLKVAINEAKVKIQKMENQVAKYKKALELSKKRLSIYKIAKILNIQWHTANNWVNTKKHLPTLLNVKLGETSNDCEIK